MKLYELIQELQTMGDNYGECQVEIAHDSENILDSFEIGKVCFFKDGDIQRAIIVEQ